MAEFRHVPKGQSQQNKHHKSHRSKSGGKVEVSIPSKIMKNKTFLDLIRLVLFAD